MKTQALVVTDDPVYLSWLQNAAPGWDFSLVRSVEAEDLVTRAQAAGRVDLILFQFDRANASERVALVERTLQRLPTIAVAGIGEDEDPGVMLSAMRSGARDFLVLKRDEAQAPTLLGRLLRLGTGGLPPRRQGKLLAVLGPYPDDGLAFLGEHLALACAERRVTDERRAAGERILFIDMAAPAGAGAVFLDLKQSYGVLDALQDMHRFDATLIETTFAKHPSGTYVLSLPEDLIGMPRFDPTDLLTLFDVVRNHFSCTVVTADGHSSLIAVKAALAQADRAVLLCHQSILRSRHCKHLLQALRADDCALDRLGLVVDQYARRVGLEPDNLAALFDLPSLGVLASQPAHRLQAMNTGQSMFASAPKDEYCASVRALAAAMLGAPAVKHAAAAGLFGRLFS
ncbi:MAG: AAA family ATPase [Panacagrimonas sp.]